MNFDPEKAVEKITHNKHFLKLKKIVENNPYHDKETTFDHLIKTYKFAQKAIKADFIKSPEAKTGFESYVGTHIDGVAKRDLMLIFALIHDIGKMVVFDFNGVKKTLMETDENRITMFPYHEYWGSLLVKDIVEGTGLDDEHTWYLSNCVRLHGTFNGVWTANKDLKAEEILPIIKKASEGGHVEQIFNGYCDCYSAKPFQPAIPLIHKLFNMPETYEEVSFSF